MLLQAALGGENTRYVTTIGGLPEEEGLTNFSIVRDSNKNKKIDLLVTFLQMLVIIVRFRPDVVVSTGAAPGLLGIILGRVIGARPLWIDSIEFSV